MVEEEINKEIFLTIKLEYVFHTEKKIEEMIKAINEFTKEHYYEGCQEKTYKQRIVPLYKSSRD